MRILILGAPFLAPALKDLGHTVYSVGWQSTCDLHISSPLSDKRLVAHLREQSFTPDALLYTDDGGLPFLLGVERLPWPSIFYSIDTFCNPWHVSYSYAFDMVCVAQKGYLPLFEGILLGAQWLPLFALQVPKLYDFSERDIPVAFVGTLQPKNIPDRLEFLESFKARAPLVYLSGEYVPIFNRAQIVLNQTAVSEVNFRCFEAMACGAALLTEQGEHGLTDLFTPHEHILPTYTRGNALEAAVIASSYMKQPELLAALAARGAALVRTQHTAAVRARQLCDWLHTLDAQAAHHARLTLLEERKPFLAAAYAMLAAELCEPETREHRELYHRLWMELQQV